MPYRTLLFAVVCQNGCLSRTALQLQSFAAEHFKGWLQLFAGSPYSLFTLKGKLGGSEQDEVSRHGAVFLQKEQQSRTQTHLHRSAAIFLE